MDSRSNLTFNNSINNSTSANEFINASGITTTTSQTASSAFFAQTRFIVYFAFDVAGMLANIYVIIVIVFHKPMQKQMSNLLIINQAIIDFIIGAIQVLEAFFYFPLVYSFHTYTPGKFSDEALCRIWYSHVPQFGILDSSTYNIVALTLERFIAIVHPIWYKTTFSKSRLLEKIIITCVWFIGPAYYVAIRIPSYEINSQGLCVYSISGATAAIIGSVTFAFDFMIPLTAIIFGYIFIINALRKRGKVSLAIESQIADNPNNSPQSGYQHGCLTNLRDYYLKLKRFNGRETALTQLAQSGNTLQHAGPGIGSNDYKVKKEKAERAVLKTAALIAASFVVCWTPPELYFLYVNIYPKTIAPIAIVWIASITRILNGCANPIIYSATHSEFKKGAVSLFNRVKKSTQTEESTQKTF